jgi:hypothetical protein
VHGRLLRANLVQDSNQVLGVRLPWGSESSGRGSEAPVPRRSNMISRENEASVRKNRAIPGSSQAMSRWPKLPVVITRSGGPSPSTW